MPPKKEQVLAEPVNSRPNYMASTTLTKPLAWQCATLLQGEVPDAVAALKQKGGGGDLYVIGSTHLVQALIDRLRSEGRRQAHTAHRRGTREGLVRRGRR